MAGKRRRFSAEFKALLALSGPQDNARAFDEPLGYAPTARVANQLLAYLGRKVNDGGCPHVREHIRPRLIRQETSGTLH